MFSLGFWLKIRRKNGREEKKNGGDGVENEIFSVPGDPVKVLRYLPPAIGLFE